jgi:GTP cyclohydrolase I
MVINKLIDIQNNKPEKLIDIDEVGVKNLRVPLVVVDRKNGKQQTVGNISIFVNLPRDYKGTHMSRFIELLNKYVQQTLSVKVIDSLILDVINSLDARKARIDISFPYFISKISPVSKKSSLLDYNCGVVCTACKKNSKNTSEDEENENKCAVERVISVEVPITTVCPCSKEISDFGAHNQRGYVTVSLKYNKFIWFEEIIELVEKQASCEIYSLLKREDEKFVTESSYNNPKFVEDIVRAVSSKLLEDKRVVWFKVECENYESIHNHNAYASIEKTK